MSHHATPATADEVTLHTYAIGDNLPFHAFIEIVDPTRGDDAPMWERSAQGSSVEWLDEAAREEAGLFARVRVVSQWGTVLADYSRP